MKTTFYRLLLLFCLLLCLLLAACGAPSVPDTPEPLPNDPPKAEAAAPPQGPAFAVFTPDELFGSEYAYTENLRAAGEYPITTFVWEGDFIYSGKAEVEQQLREAMADDSLRGYIFPMTYTGLAAQIAAAQPREEDFFAYCHLNETDPGTGFSPDLCLMEDAAQAARVLAENARDLGAETLVYYYFYNLDRKDADGDLLRLHQAEAEAACADLGLEFVPVLLTKNEGQMFIEKDLPERVAVHGHNTAFFCLNNVMASVLARLVPEQGAVLPCITPYSLANSLGLEVARGHYGDYEWLRAQFREKLAAYDNPRLSCFPMDSTDLFLRASLAYGEKWLAGAVERDSVDLSVLRRILEDLTGAPCTLRYYESDGVTHENAVLVSLYPVKLE